MHDIIIQVDRQVSNPVDPVYLIFTTDTWKSYSSRFLRGISKEESNAIEIAKLLLKNKVVDSEEELLIIEVPSGYSEVDGSYI